VRRHGRRPERGQSGSYRSGVAAGSAGQREHPRVDPPPPPASHQSTDQPVGRSQAESLLASDHPAVPLGPSVQGPLQFVLFNDFS
jgi:hypothetical protein